MRRDAEARERLFVLRRAVAGVAFPAESRVAPGQGGHDLIAGDLGDDGSGRSLARFVELFAERPLFPKAVVQTS